MSQVEIRAFYVASSDIHRGDMVKYRPRILDYGVCPTDKKYDPDNRVVPFIGEAKEGNVITVLKWDNISYAHEAHTTVSNDQIKELVKKFKRR